MNKFSYIISFGGNVGERELIARKALDLLSGVGSIGRQSRKYYTKPLSSDVYHTTDHEDYLNFVFEFHTTLAPSELYLSIRAIEDYFGRDRSRRWLPRPVDLDLLLCARNEDGAENFEPRMAFVFYDRESDLRIPHAELGKRDFLLKMISSDLHIDVAGLIHTGE